mgnify:CR=1 FL=1|jgi:hypothetical protein
MQDCEPDPVRSAAYVFPGPHLTHGGAPVGEAHPAGHTHPRFNSGQRHPVCESLATSPAGQERHCVPPAPNLPLVWRSIARVNAGQCWQGRVPSLGEKEPGVHLLQLRTLPAVLLAPKPGAHTGVGFAACVKRQTNTAGQR